MSPFITIHYPPFGRPRLKVDKRTKVKESLQHERYDEAMMIDREVARAGFSAYKAYKEWEYEIN